MPTFFEIEGFLVRDQAHRLAGVAEATFLLTSENAHLAQVDLSVRADMRRRGIGGALLGAVAHEASARGRTLLVGAAGDRIGGGEPFARRFGAVPAHTSRTSRLVVADVDRATVDDWIAHGPAGAQGYSLLQVDGRCPDDLVAQVVDLLGVMNDAPSGDLQLEDRRITIAQFRESEQQIGSKGGVPWWIFARHDDSHQLVGLSGVTWNPSFPEIVSQGDTGVRIAHRGHRLGRWMKASMLRRILDERPQVLEVRTNNADSNASMLAINEALGFEPYIAWTTWQAELDLVVARLHETG